MNPVPIYTALLKRKMMMGIPQTIFLLIIGMSIIMMFGFEQYWFIGVSLILIIVSRSITKNDEFLLEIILDSLLEANIYRV